MMLYSLNLGEWVDKNLNLRFKNYKNIQNFVNNNIMDNLLKEKNIQLIFGHYNPFGYFYSGIIMDKIEYLVKKENIQRLIFLSSFGVYGPKYEEPYKEEDKINPQNIFGINALLYENFLSYLNSRYGVDTYILRLFTLYGPFETQETLIPNLMKSFIKNEEVYVGDLKKVRDFIYIDDFVSLIYKITNKNIDNKIKVYNVGTSKGTNIKDVITLIENISNKKPNIIFDPSRIKTEYDYDYAVANINKIKKELNWEPKIPLSEGLKLTYQWMLGRG